MNNRLSRVVGMLAAGLTLASTLAISAPRSLAQSAPILSQQGTLQPAVKEYSIQIEAGQALTILTDSDDFLPSLILLDASGAEVAFGTSSEADKSSSMTYVASEAGEYTIVVRAFGAEGGDYRIQVRPATEYELSMNMGRAHLDQGDYDAAIAFFSDAIRLDPNQPEPYQFRGHAYFSRAYYTPDASGAVFDGPTTALTEETRNAIINDFLAAAALYEARGQTYEANYLRAEAEYVQTGEYPPYEPTEEPAP